MGTITLPNGRASSDFTFRVKLKDGGLFIDWTELSDIKAYIYSDAQKALAGRCAVAVDGSDHTILVCEYAATKPQYLGINSIVIRAKYMGRDKTYDKPAVNIVSRTFEASGSVVLQDPTVDIEILVEDVSSSILDNILAACVKATEEAQQIVDVHRGPAGASAYEIAVEEGFTGTEDEWLASLVGPQGETGPTGVTGATARIMGNTDPSPSVTVDKTATILNFTFRGIQGPEGAQGIQGDTGAAAGFGTVAATVDENVGTPSVNVTTSGPDTAKNISFAFSNMKGETGATPAFSIGDVTTGAAGSSASATITGTAAAPVLNLTIPKGDQGNTGSSVDYPYELVNNRTTNDATKGLSAAEGYRIGQDLDQLDLEVSRLAGRFYGVFEDDSDLPDDATSVGYAFVGENEPFAIWNFNGTAWSDSGAEAVGLQGPQGNSGYTGAVGELEVVNNLEDGGATAALSAEMGKLLSRNMKLLYDSMGAAAFWGDKPAIDWSGNSVPVSLTLTDCTIDNLADSVPLGDSYEATITPDAGNILGTVICTMNGEPQTVVNGHITIAEVTGSITITATGINLDTVAYENKTYKQIFETNNWLGISPGFENGSYSPMIVGAGTPAVSNDEVDSGTYALKAFGSTSQQIKSSVSGNKKKMFIACRVKVTRYVSGSAGVQYSSSGIVAQQAVTDWKTICYVNTPSNDVFVFVGSWSSADLDCYVDTPVAILGSYFSTQPTLEQFTSLYETYVAIKKAA